MKTFLIIPPSPDRRSVPGREWDKETSRAWVPETTPGTEEAEVLRSLAKEPEFRRPT